METGCSGWDNVGVGESATMVGAGGGVLVSIVAGMLVTPSSVVKVGGGMINGVGVMIAGVIDGMGD